MDELHRCERCTAGPGSCERGEGCVSLTWRLREGARQAIPTGFRSRDGQGSSSITRHVNVGLWSRFSHLQGSTMIRSLRCVNTVAVLKFKLAFAAPARISLDGLVMEIGQPRVQFDRDVAERTRKEGCGCRPITRQQFNRKLKSVQIRILPQLATRTHDRPHRPKPQRHPEARRRDARDAPW